MKAQARHYEMLDVQTSIDSASSHQLIDMLFQGMRTRLLQAVGSIERGDLETKAAAISACVDILGGLQASLDHEQGGEIAANLDGLYDYMQRRLFRASVDNDIEALKEVNDLVDTLRSAWVAIDPEVKADG